MYSRVVYLSMVLLLASVTTGCQSLLESIAPRVGYTQSSKVHAFQSYSFIYSFASGNNRLFQAALDAVESDWVPLATALAVGGHRVDMVVEGQLTGGTVHYAVHADVWAKGAKKAIRLPGIAGTAPAEHAAATAQAASATGIAPALLQQGHFALFGLVNTATGLGVEEQTMRRHAFALIALKAKVEAGQKADWFGGNRPPADTIADADYALALIDNNADRVARAQAEVMALFAIAVNAREPAAVQTLLQELAASRARADHWARTHRQPTVQDFGIVWQMPSPETVMASIEKKFGIVGAALKVAKGVVTGDVSATLDGLGKLCPEGSTAQTVLGGLGAAARGDIQGAAKAIADVAGFSDEVTDMQRRLSDFGQTLDGAASLQKRL